jgi:ribonuclease HI
MNVKKIKIFTDGGARGNPGPAAIGIVIKDESGRLLKSIGEPIGRATNNQAEYQAVIRALDYVISEIGQAEIEIFLDSQLVACQLNGEYKIKNPGLKPLFYRVREQVMKLGGRVSFIHIPREKNKEADRLLNRVLDSI